MQAVWSGDGEWYNASITGVSAANNFVVLFDEDGGIEEVRFVDFRFILHSCPNPATFLHGLSGPNGELDGDSLISTNGLYHTVITDALPSTFMLSEQQSPQVSVV